ncbi:hypothetical protein TraAM80_01843 [Trypanosoma rangeli]|uniref:Uncharacterized protein n=1 Tax=Trypanosoma rangeli TaxID=5698 RepID=A0A3R7NZ89_TRYRA|nr:uncharacterized protein TraAM80_01843 [Trypanosoma rangeli]RNF10094.1 hypothetical protein TraAM80_01843 [Trypanosoma rangeli]|eukprot:RNF10094.1 hypothetical protein TraAM80_01843 [Trypanosoma rangeli]
MGVNCCFRRSVRLALVSSTTRFSSFSSRSSEKDLMGSSFGGQSSSMGSSTSWNTNPLVGRISTGASPLVVVADGADLIRLLLFPSASSCRVRGGKQQQQQQRNTKQSACQGLNVVPVWTHLREKHTHARTHADTDLNAAVYFRHAGRHTSEKPQGDKSARTTT